MSSLAATLRRRWPAVHYFRNAEGVEMAKVLPGDFYVTRPPELITTLLGSCVAVCVRDPQAELGGLNHFMLPESPGPGGWLQQGRYGAFAMELLINELLKQGASRERLEVKVFGGGDMGGYRTHIGEQNVAFVRKYVAAEGLAVASWDVGGEVARKLIFHVGTGRVQVQKLAMDRSRQELTAEQSYREKLNSARHDGTVEIFEG